MTNAQRKVVDDVYANWRAKNKGSLDFFLFREVIRRKAAEQRHLVSKFENDDGETREIPIRWNDPSSPTRKVTLHYSDVDWESQRADNRIPTGTTGWKSEWIAIRVPASSLDRLERGLALRQTWSSRYGPGAPVRSYSGFAEWATEAVMEFAQRESDKIGDDRTAEEEAELYPELGREPVRIQLKPEAGGRKPWE